MYRKYYTVQIRASATTFCLESETKKNSPDFTLPKWVKSILHEKVKKEMVDFLVVVFFLNQEPLIHLDLAHNALYNSTV